MLILSVLMSLVTANSLWAADDELYAAMFVDNLLFEAYNEHGMTGNIETLAKMADMKTLERVAGSASKVENTADIALKIVKAYQEGKRGAELAEVVAKEVGKFGYSKIKNMAAGYIKSKVSVLGQLESAYQVFGALHDTSSYIAYVGMSIGLDMMSEETIAQLEKSGFHKAAVWITDNTNKILSMAEEGKQEAIKQFLIATEGTAIERAAYAVTDALGTVWDMAQEGAADIWDKVSGWFSDDEKNDNNDTPTGDNVSNPDNDPDGDNVVSGDNNDGDNSSNTPSGDSVVNGDEPQSGSGNSNNTPSGDDVSSGFTDTPIDWEHNSDDDTPAIGNVLEKIKENSPIVGPNIPHYRVLWIFAGENWADAIKAAGKGIGDLISNIKEGNISITSISDSISDEMGFKDMKAALESIGD